MNNYIVMTVKGRKDLTLKCLTGLIQLNKGQFKDLVLVDAGFREESLTYQANQDSVLQNLFRDYVYLQRVNCNIPEGWNIGIRYLVDISRVDLKDSAIWLMNNDVEIKNGNWLSLMHDRLCVEGTGTVGSTAMSVFGHGFATGGVWGFRLDAALAVAENGNVLDERFHYSCQDVDLSIRMAKAGYTVTHVPGVEYGPDPMLIHAESQTMFSLEAKESVLEKRKLEFRLLIDKHGRRDGKDGYEGL